MKVFGLIGKTLKHSFSKKYFTQKFQNEHITDASYENFELSSIDQLCTLIQNNSNIKGLNVTIPYKEEVLSILTERTPAVEEIGACNCIKITNGRLKGYNTDAYGFIQSLRPHLKPHQNHALILGTGGASKAVQFALKQEKINFLLVSRKKDFNILGYDEIDDDILKKYTIIINTTPLGMFPAMNDEPPLPFEYLSKDHLLFDLIYNPLKTQFLQKGSEKGAYIINGYEMLVLQAEASWKIWNEND